MKKLLLPLIFALVGAGGGVGAGLFLRPPPEPMEEVAEDEQPTLSLEDMASQEKDEPDQELEYAKMSNQFVVPIVKDDRVVSLVVMSLTLEVSLGGKDTVYAREPRIRDTFLQVMFDHANFGGFDGEFTDPSNLEPLRKALLESAQKQLGDMVTDVLISELGRQDT